MTRYRSPAACILLCLAGIGTPVRPAFGQQVWINEIHYDNSVTDTNEGIEIAGPAGTDLSDYRLVLYNGVNGLAYSNCVLSGALSDQTRGYGALWFPAVGLQNGAPDGVALVLPDNTVVQFLSYEGAFMAANGPATGWMSANIGVAEEPAPPEGQSLQLIGSGGDYLSFAWAGPRAHSRGLPNDGQTFPARLRATSATMDAAGRFVEAGGLTNLGAAGQPGGVGVCTAGSLVHQAGFLNAFSLRPHLDTDGDGLPNEADPDNDNDDLGDEAEILGTSFMPPVATALNRADTDNDGASDGAEAATETDPTDAMANLALVAIRRTGSTMGVAWRARSGKTYEVLKDDGATYNLPTQVMGTAQSWGGVWPWFVVTNTFNDAGAGTNGGFYGIRVTP